MTPFGSDPFGSTLDDSKLVGWSRRGSKVKWTGRGKVKSALKTHGGGPKRGPTGTVWVGCEPT